MQWLQDKKNLPFIIGGVAVVLIVAGVFVFMTMKGGSTSESQTATTATSGPGGTSTPGAPITQPGMTPAPSWPAAPATATVTVPGAPGAQPAAGQPGTQQATTLAAEPQPDELWRADPFAPDVVAPKRKVRIIPPLDLPSLGPIFPPAVRRLQGAPPPTPQPPRRVAGILFGDKVGALIQTVNGFEAVRPGQRLNDGAVVERIERDRVILRTADAKPRLIEIKLAASVVPLEAPQQTGPTGGYSPGGMMPGSRRLMTPPGGPGPAGPRRSGSGYEGHAM